MFVYASNRVGPIHVMLSGRITRTIIRSLDWLAKRFLPADDDRPIHHHIGTRGEEDAYFFLRKIGYTIVARNFRSPRSRGEIDLIGWDKDVLCFIEVKSRTSHSVKPPEAAVDYHKRRELAKMAHEYLKRFPPSCQWRFDIVSVYYGGRSSLPQMELFRNASQASRNQVS
jgi:putative endonuclease